MGNEEHLSSMFLGFWVLVEEDLSFQTRSHSNKKTCDIIFNELNILIWAQNNAQSIACCGIRVKIWLPWENEKKLFQAPSKHHVGLQGHFLLMSTSTHLVLGWFKIPALMWVLEKPAPPRFDLRSNFALETKNQSNYEYACVVTNQYLPNIVNLVGKHNHHSVVGVRTKCLWHAGLLDVDGRSVTVFCVVNVLTWSDLADNLEKINNSY